MLVMVLNDGETFTHLSGCKIVEAPDEVEDVKNTEYPVVCEFGEATDHPDILVYWKPHKAQRTFVEFGSTI